MPFSIFTSQTTFWKISHGKKRKDAIGASIATARRRVEMAEVKKLQVKETEKEIEVIEETIKGISAALKNAENDLKQCVLRSPLTGSVFLILMIIDGRRTKKMMLMKRKRKL